MMMNMKHNAYFILVVIFFISCLANQNRPTNILAEEEYQENKPIDRIAIETTFEPTLDLTDEIRNTSLEDLIKQEKGMLSSSDQLRQKNYERRREKLLKEEKVRVANKYREEGYSEQEIKGILNSPYFGMALMPPLSYSESDILYDYKLKYVPITSNLAKVYYLENMGDFIRHNSEYYDEIIRKNNEEKYNQIRQEQNNLDKYL